MGHVVLDSHNLEAIVKDATGEGLEPVVLPTSSGTSSKEAAKPSEKPVEGEKPKTEAVEDPDDIEGDDGLTPRQKRDLTQKMQTAIGKKHRALKDAEEFATEQYNERRLAEQRAEGFEREINRLKTQLQGTKPQESAEAEKPKRENFETDEAFRDAMDDWRVDQKFKAREAADAKAREEARQAEVVATAKARIAHALKVIPDFAEVTGAVDLEVPPVIAGYMQESELFAELGYHFAKYPEELERLQKLPPARALVEIGKIESKLTPFAAPATKVTNGQDTGSAPSSNGAQPSTETGSNPSQGANPSKPRAAAPIKPLSSGSAVQVDKPERDMDAKEAMAAWQKKRHVNLTRRQRH